MKKTTRRSFLQFLGLGVLAGPAIASAKPLASGGVVKAAPRYLVGEAPGESIVPWREFRPTGKSSISFHMDAARSFLNPGDAVNCGGRKFRVDTLLSNGRVLEVEGTLVGTDEPPVFCADADAVNVCLRSEIEDVTPE